MPKIAEINTICREIGREQVYYEPEILTDVKSDGTKMSRVVVRVYPNSTDREESSQIPWDDFTDVVYEKVKEMYEDAEEHGFDEQKYVFDHDGENFGWALADTWQKIGDVFIFLISVYNLCDSKDESPIIDSKGLKQGMQMYSLSLQLLDTDKTTKLDVLEYEAMNQPELQGKYLQMNLELKRASELPEKYTFKTQAKYEWLDEEKTVFESKVVDKHRTPDFNYKNSHMIQITDEIVEYLMQNTLKISIHGMIEAKKPVETARTMKSSATHDENQDLYEVQEAKGEMATPRSKSPRSSVPETKVTISSGTQDEIERLE